MHIPSLEVHTLFVDIMILRLNTRLPNSSAFDLTGLLLKFGPTQKQGEREYYLKIRYMNVGPYVKSSSCVRLILIKFLFIRLPVFIRSQRKRIVYTLIDKIAE